MASRASKKKKSKKTSKINLDPQWLKSAQAYSMEFVLQVYKFLDSLNLDNLDASIRNKDLPTVPVGAGEFAQVISFSQDKVPYRLLFFFECSDEKTIESHMLENIDLNEPPMKLFSYISNYWIQLNEGTKSYERYPGTDAGVILVDGSPHWKGKAEIFPHHYHDLYNGDKHQLNDYYGSLDHLFEILSNKLGSVGLPADL